MLKTDWGNIPVRAVSHWAQQNTTLGFSFSTSREWSLAAYKGSKKPEPLVRVTRTVVLRSGKPRKEPTVWRDLTHGWLIGQLSHAFVCRCGLEAIYYRILFWDMDYVELGHLRKESERDPSFHCLTMFHYAGMYSQLSAWKNFIRRTLQSAGYWRGDLVWAHSHPIHCKGCNAGMWMQTHRGITEAFLP